MTGSLIEPNLHAVLVHFPMALILLGGFLEVFQWLWHRSNVRSAGRWMIVLGILSAIPAMTSGLYALRQTANPDAPEGVIWDAVASSSSWTDAQWAALERHVTYMAAGGLLLLVSVVIWIAASDNARQRMYLLGIAILLAGAGMIAYGAHQGGRLVYRFGTGVHVVDKTSLDVIGEQGISAIHRAEDLVSPMELHTVLAGVTIAIIAAALGLSVRRSNVVWENRLAEERAVAAGYRPAGQLGQKANVLAIPTIYPGRFWILAIFCGLATLATGLWLFDALRPAQMLQLLQRLNSRRLLNDEWRPFIHGYLALILITLSIFLGIILRFAPRRRFVMGILCTLMVLSLCLQVWSGILMLFDGPEGTLFRFSRPQANAPMVAPIVTEPAKSTSEPVLPIPGPASPANLRTTSPATTNAAR